MGKHGVRTTSVRSVRWDDRIWDQLDELVKASREKLSINRLSEDIMFEKLGLIREEDE